MSVDRLHKARIDGLKAQALVHDETLKEAFEELRRTYSARLMSTKVDQTAEREILYQAHRLVGEVEQHLISVLNNGKLADAELQDITRK